MTIEEDLLRCLMHVVGRAAVPMEEVREIVGSGKKQISAFNLCDGTRTIAEIAHKTKIKPGNMSRTATRWRASGIAFWVGEGKEARLLHIYPLPKATARGRRARGQRAR